MKRRIVILLLIFSVIILGGCAKEQVDLGDLQMDDRIVKDSVKGWMVYTNPAYRYELRLPKSWDFEDSGEDGKTLKLFSDKDKENLAIAIYCYSNWQENYSLQDFYKNQEQNLFESDYEKEDVTLAGKSGVRFKGVQKDEKTYDLIALEANDRIIEIELREFIEESKIVLNSLYFYGN